MGSEALLRSSPLVLMFVGILLMVIDGVRYGVNVANFGFLLTIVGIFLYFAGVRK